MSSGSEDTYGDMVAMGGYWFESVQHVTDLVRIPGPGAGTREKVQYGLTVEIHGHGSDSYDRDADVHDEPKRGVRQRRRWWRRAGLAAAVVVVGSGTAIASTGTWRPQLGSLDRRPAPVASARSMLADQRAVLEVMRRAQNDRDRARARTREVGEAIGLLDRAFVHGAPPADEPVAEVIER